MNIIDAPAGSQQQLVRLLRWYMPKAKQEPFFCRADWQPDPIPNSGLWEAVGVVELDGHPLWTLRCLAPWDDRFSMQQTIRVREALVRLCFDQVEILRTPLSPNASSSATPNPEGHHGA